MRKNQVTLLKGSVKILKSIFGSRGFRFIDLLIYEINYAKISRVNTHVLATLYYLHRSVRVIPKELFGSPQCWIFWVLYVTSRDVDCSNYKWNMRCPCFTTGFYVFSLVHVILEVEFFFVYYTYVYCVVIMGNKIRIISNANNMLKRKVY